MFALFPLDRIGAVVFSESSEILFHLHDYTRAEDVATSLLRAPYLARGTATGEALDLVRLGALDPSRGWRSGETMIVLITDGPSAESSGRVETAASALRLVDGVTLLGVGIGSADVDELHNVTGMRSRVLYTRRIDDLVLLTSPLHEKICASPTTTSTTTTTTTTTTTIITTTSTTTTTTTTTTTSTTTTTTTTLAVPPPCPGDFLPRRQAKAVDLVWLLDSSGSLDAAGWEATVEFASLVTEGLPLGELGLRWVYGQLA